MFSFFKSSGKIPVMLAEPAEPAEPVPGEFWESFDKGDPFPSKHPPIKILDVKDGWVRYSMSGTLFTDERKEMKYFVKIYRKNVYL